MPVHFIALTGSDLGQLFIQFYNDTLIQAVAAEGVVDNVNEPLIQAVIDP